MKRPRLPMAATLALSCVLLYGQASAQVSAASLTGLNLGAAYLADTNAEDLTSETAFLNDAAQRFKLGGSCAQVELFDLDSAHYSYPGSAQVGAFAAVTAAFKAGGYAVQALDHNVDDKSTDDFFLATRGGLRLLSNVYGNANGASLEWCSLPTAAGKAAKPAPTPAAQAPVRSATPKPATAKVTQAPVQPAAPTATPPAGASTGVAPVWKVGDRVAAGPGAGFHPATVLEVSGHSYHLHYDDHYQPDSTWVAYGDIYYLDPQKRAEAAAQDQAALNSYQPHDWKVGDRVMAGPGVPNHPATVLEVSPSKNYYHLHYDDHFVTDDIWVATYDLRPIDAARQAIAAAASGPRLGKYLILGYPGTDGQYNGYFVLQSGGHYEVFNPGGRSVGSGAYTFDAATTTVHWKSGPFTTWTGSQKFEVSREGKTHIIRLMPSTIGSNSTDSNK